MHYVYILQCVVDASKFYVGCTEDLKSRFEKHNKGEVSHTSKFKPWILRTYLAFDNKERAYAFERYLKSHSGRIFQKKRF